MTKLAFLVDNYFEQVELTETRDILEEHGHQTVLIATEQLNVQGMQSDVNKKDHFRADLLLKDAKPSDYDALILPGGTVNADKLRINQQAQQFVRDFLAADKLVAAICHAPWLLISTQVVKGKNITAFGTPKTMPHLPLARHVERRAPLRVKRTQPLKTPHPRGLQLQIRADYLGDIEFLLNLLFRVEHGRKVTDSA